MGMFPLLTIRLELSAFIMRLSHFLIVSILGFLSSHPGRADANLSRGRALYTLCTSCHGPGGHGSEQFKAPALAGLPDWYIAEQLKRFADGRRGAHPDDQHGLMMRPMAKTLRSEDDVAAVSAFIASLKPKLPKATITEGNLDKGKAMYMICMSCHGDKLQGNDLLKTPTLKHLQDWYQLSQLKKFKHRVRFDATDPQSLQMQAITAGVPDEETMRDIVFYVSQVVHGKADPPALPVAPAPPTPPPAPAAASPEPAQPAEDQTPPEENKPAPKGNDVPAGQKAKTKSAPAPEPAPEPAKGKGKGEKAKKAKKSKSNPKSNGKEKAKAKAEPGDN